MLVAALITGACTAPGNVEESAPTPPPDPLASADRLLAQGQYAQAAAAYQALPADAPPEQAARALGLAALAWQEAGDMPRAAQLLAAQGPAAASNPLLALAGARAELRAGQAESALAHAQAIEPTTLAPYARGVRARVIAAAATGLRNFTVAGPAWIEAFALPHPVTEQTVMGEAALGSLTGLGAAELGQRIAASAADPAAHGWYTLAALAQQANLDPSAVAPRLDEWRQGHPGHPATPLIEGILERASAASARPARVALILPFDATLGTAGRAVRDGFITAWFRDGQRQARPALTVYPNGGDDILKDYQRAVADGAQFVIGPLQKNLVERLAASPDLPVPVLALNVVDARPGAPAARPGFYQFGLTPEDEAAQVAQRAYGVGTRALIIAPSSAWGTRLGAAYGRAWQNLGGTVLGQVVYSEAADAYVAAIRRALNIDVSEARAAALRRRLGIPLHAEVRHRADIDVILLAALPNNARQLLPQLRYFGADSIPVFATSNVYAGASSAERDVDLNGLVFGDMPWLFGQVDRESYDLVRRSWPGPAASYARLYAFGIDAYRVLPFLSRMRARASMRVPGVTGDLWMDTDGVLHRNMSWLRFDDGVPTVIGEADGLGAR